MKHENLMKIVFTGVFAALSYVVYTFLQFRFSITGVHATSIPPGNDLCVRGALLLGGVYGGLGGAIGMTIGDLMDPVYILYAPKTFLLKFCIGLITGLIAHNLGKITYQTDTKKVFKWVTLATIGGLLFNVIFDPLIGYWYKRLVLGKPAADVALVYSIGSTTFNAVVSAVVAVAIYTALRPALKKAGLFFTIGKQKDEKK